MDGKRRKPDIHDPGRRYQELPPELVEANRRAGARPETGADDGTDLSGREHDIDEGMHEPFAGHPRPHKSVTRH